MVVYGKGLYDIMRVLRQLADHRVIHVQRFRKMFHDRTEKSFTRCRGDALRNGAHGLLDLFLLITRCFQLTHPPAHLL